MLYENGRIKSDGGGSKIVVDISNVERLIRESNADLVAKIVGKLGGGFAVTGIRQQDEDFAKETMSKLAEMIGESRSDGEINDIGSKTDIESDLQKDKGTIDILKSLGL